jgi:hypothetical protein
LPCEPEALGAAGNDDRNDGHVSATSAAGGSTIVDLLADGAAPRAASVVTLAPNANLMDPHVVVPSLRVTVPAGTWLLACAVGVSHEKATVTAAHAPDLAPALLDALQSFTARADGAPI